MALFASGFLQRLHAMEHEREDAVADDGIACVSDKQTPQSAPHGHHHSEENCPICAQFHAPMTSSSTVIWLVDTGCWVRYVSMLAVSQQSQTLPERLTARGPPASLSC
jgi:hypothetical protein